MKKFIRYSIIFCTPILLWTATYISIDPFKVLRHHDVYYDSTSVFPINTPLISTMAYVNQREKYHYDSFIFENSRSLFYDVNEWEKYLPEHNACLHFWTSCGYIKSWHDKVKFIDENHDTIRNALCILDHETLSSLENTTFWHAIEPPVLDHNYNWLNFQIEHFKAWCDIRFIASLIDFKLFGKYRSYMKNYLMDPTRQERYNPVTNERRRPDAEKKIADGTYYDAKHMKVFENIQKPGTYSKHILTDEERRLIREIRTIFDRHHTNYEIILGPQYDQIKLNENTMEFLYNTFGREHVHDFTGVNKWTSDYHNYYEESHYRPCVANEILKLVYEKK